jgi:YaiO family outer membrane protein
MVSVKKHCLIFPLVCLLLSVTVYSQDTSSSDALLHLAKKAAFEEKDYGKAKAFLYRALEKSPDYADVGIFLGRIYSWTKNYDSARICFDRVLTKDPAYEDASVAYADLEYWNKHDEKALHITETGLTHHPQSKDLLLQKVKILASMKKYAPANDALSQLLKIDKNNSEARAMYTRINEEASKNRISINYDYTSFDKQFADPWHMVSFDYGRTTPIGLVIGRVSYANRFKQNGTQFELEAYPHISKTFYCYVNAGYSNDIGVFSQWRGGFSLYANLPKSYEGELGVRYLQFSGPPSWIYTAYLGKYYKSWLFGARAYIIPVINTSTVSASYNGMARYYYGSADDWMGIALGYGISPDDRSNAIQLDNPVKLTSYKLGLSYRKKVARMNVLSLDANWFNQEYLPQTKGNQYEISIGWLHRF